MWFSAVTDSSAAAGESAGRFVFHMSNPSHQQLADSVLNQTRRRLAELVRDTLTESVHVHLPENIREFERLVRGRFPDWGAAVAIPTRDMIVIKSPDHFVLGKPLEMLLAHEYTHLVMHKRTGYFSAPRWLEEGLAQYVSHEWNWQDYLALSRAGLFGDFLSLKEIDHVNRFNESRAQLAYAEAYVAVDHFLGVYGVAQFNLLLDSLRAGVSIDKSLVAATGATYMEFEEEFLETLATRYNLVTLFMDTMLFWLGLAIIVVIATYLRYRRRRQYYKRWEREETLHSTDFDYGDPDHPEQKDDDEAWRS